MRPLGSHWAGHWAGHWPGHLGGHLGALVSALVDDQLEPREAERGWRHVGECRGCREAVQQELWVKNRLHAAPAPELPPLPDPALTAALSEVAAVGPAQPPRRGVRRTGVAVLGAGGVSVAALTGLLLVVDQPPPGPAPRVPFVVESPPGPMVPASIRRGVDGAPEPSTP